MVFADQLQLNGGPRDVRVARHWLGDWLASQGVTSEAIDATTLLVSELVTNALIHTGTVITVCAKIAGKRVRVEVTDRDPRSVPTRRSAAHDAERGRGVGIVEALAATWGVDRSATSKTVWFEMACC